MDHTKIRIIGLCCLLVVFAPLGIDLYLPALPEISEVYQGNARYTLSFYFLGLAFGQLFAGTLADKFGRKPVILSCLILFGMSALCINFTHYFAFILLFRIFQGLAAGGLVAGWMILVQDSFRVSQTASCYGFLNAVLNTIPVVAPILGSSLILLADSGAINEVVANIPGIDTSMMHWFDAWRVNFWLLAACAFIVFMVFLFTYRETKTVATPPLDFKLFKQVLIHPNFLKYGFSCCAAHAFVLSYVTLAPGIIMEEVGASHVTFTRYFAGNAFLIMVLCYFVPFFIKRFGQDRVFCIGLQLMLLGGYLLILCSRFNDPLSFMVAIHVACLGFGLFLAPAKSYVLMPFKHVAGTCAAFLGFLDLILTFAVSSLMSFFDMGALGLGVFLAVTMMFGLWITRDVSELNKELI